MLFSALNNAEAAANAGNDDCRGSQIDIGWLQSKKKNGHEMHMECMVLHEP